MNSNIQATGSGSISTTGATGNIYANGGGNIYTSGNIYTTGSGDIQTVNGDISSNTGNIFTNSGIISTGSGLVQTPQLTFNRQYIANTEGFTINGNTTPLITMWGELSVGAGGSASISYNTIFTNGSYPLVAFTQKPRVTISFEPTTLVVSNIYSSVLSANTSTGFTVTCSTTATGGNVITVASPGTVYWHAIGI